ncbi:alginate lyase family protein [Superficieibacter sp. HKU1]|uniref:alginate lyase family protein n=1 Tax=Superficieibacter sp. HKU1 TaxID=3031919 RepID=UPI0023E1E459|nr:alginate lyase family protein [Superficieibacter sp. HKU1]WES66717.1 alginate lyase family protein [Superficieibacter sp. HKU1]
MNKKNIFFIICFMFYCLPAYPSNDRFCKEVSKKIIPLDQILLLHPNPKKEMHFEGLLPEQIQSNDIIAMKDMTIIGRLTKYWLINKDEKSLKKLVSYFNEWLTVYNPNFNPIDETKFDTLFFSYYKIRSSLTQSERNLFDSKIKYWAEGYLKRINGPFLKNSDNNWQSHRIKLLTIMGVSLHNDEIFNETKLLYLKQLKDNIDSNSVTLDYKQHNAIRYAIYDLLPLLQAASYARLKGDSWIDMQINGKKKLIDATKWVLPYATGEKKHMEFENSNKSLDIKRKEYNVYGYSGNYSPEYSSVFFWYVLYMLPELIDNFNIRLDSNKEPVVMSFYCYS